MGTRTLGLQRVHSLAMPFPVLPFKVQNPTNFMIPSIQFNESGLKSLPTSHNGSNVFWNLVLFGTFQSREWTPSFAA